MYRPKKENRRPLEGSKLGCLYDFFMENKYKSFHVKEIIEKCQLSVGNTQIHTMVNQLNDFYDLDIRKVKMGYFCLVGKWNGLEYIDYCSEIFVDLIKESCHDDL